MRPAAPLPLKLRQDAFSVAEARAIGVSADRLAAHDLQRPFRGIRSPFPPPGDLRSLLVHLCESYFPRLRPGDRFSHLAAAAVLGLPLPLTPPSDVLLDVTSPVPLNPVRAAGVRGHRSLDASFIRRLSLPVSRPVDVFLELAAALDLPDLVALGDAAVLRPRVGSRTRGEPLVELDTLAEAVRTSRARGSRRAKEAVALVRPGVESPMETRLRLLIRAAGLPEPQVGHEIRDEQGRFLGFADLAYPELGLVVEYDGDHHRTDAAQYEKDQARVQAFFRAGLDVVRVRQRGLLVQPVQTARLIRAAYERAREVRDLSSGASPQE